MQRVAFGTMMAAMLAASSTALAQAPSWSPPPESARCPSKWGATDERGFGQPHEAAYWCSTPSS